jgi:hypothetical protein
MMSVIKIIPLEGKAYRLELDGIDISHYTKSISFSLNALEKARVTLELVPMDVELPVELEAVVIAKKETTDGETDG